jgi:mono/diheme cytochrome c family protein
MRKNVLAFLLFSAVFLSMIYIQSGCQPQEKKEMTKEEMVSWGEYLVTMGGCNDCHSPKVFTDMGPIPDTTKLLSGHMADAMLPPIDTSMVKPGKWVMTIGTDFTAWVGPWGISYAANLTPDEATGIGNWTDEVFIKALRTGKHMGAGRPILPPMPWFNFAKATDEDLKAILAYLKSIPPISNKVPDPVPPNMLGSMQRKSKKM